MARSQLAQLAQCLDARASARPQGPRLPRLVRSKLALRQPQENRKKEFESLHHPHRMSLNPQLFNAGTPVWPARNAANQSQSIFKTIRREKQRVQNQLRSATESPCLVEPSDDAAKRYKATNNSPVNRNLFLGQCARAGTRIPNNVTTQETSTFLYSSLPFSTLFYSLRIFAGVQTRPPPIRGSCQSLQMSSSAGSQSRALGSPAFTPVGPSPTSRTGLGSAACYNA